MYNYRILKSTLDYYPDSNKVSNTSLVNILTQILGPLYNPFFILAEILFNERIDFKMAELRNVFQNAFYRY